MLYRKNKLVHGAPVNAVGWMVSYADMVTILLAMFITLSTLSKDQTGLSFYYGTGSYRDSVTRFGLPGVSNRSSRVVSLTTAGPLYRVDGTETDKPNSPVIDPEEASFQAFMEEIKEEFPVSPLPADRGKVMLDFHTQLKKNTPYLSKSTYTRITPILDLARQPGYVVEIVYWIPAPHESAVIRSANMAASLRTEILAQVGLPQEASSRVVPVAQSWRYKDANRPTFSIVLSRQAPKQAK
jgi:hypothetical protein